MTVPKYLRPVPWRPATLPPQERSAQWLLELVATACLDAPDCPYLPQVEAGVRKTFCNMLVSDLTRALGCEVPHLLPKPVDCPHCGEHFPGYGEARVLEMRQWLVGEGIASHGWERLTDGHVAQAMADQGQVAVALYQGPVASSGHVALVIPSQGQPGVWIAQAGASCFSRGLLGRGFGALPVEFFGHP